MFLCSALANMKLEGTLASEIGELTSLTTLYVYNLIFVTLYIVFQYTFYNNMIELIDLSVLSTTLIRENPSQKKQCAQLESIAWRCAGAATHADYIAAARESVHRSARFARVDQSHAIVRAFFCFSC
jgi:hypothetical protein